MAIPSKRRSRSDDTTINTNTNTNTNNNDDERITKMTSKRTAAAVEQDTSLHSYSNPNSQNSQQQSQQPNKATKAAALQILNLKPVRDLAQNFDIDIVSSLNDYLTELDQEDLLNSQSSIQSQSSQLSLPNNNNLPPNFAQAALLLQNSSGVYSRKVEYLHTLVYQTLYSLIEQTNDPNNKHKSKSAGSAGSASSIQKKSSRQLRGDDDICLFQEFDSELQFLLLDDVLPIDVHGTRINLKQKDLIAEDDEGDTGVGAGAGAGAGVGPSTGTPNNTTLLNATRLSIGGVMIDENNSTDAATTATVVDVANTTSSNATLRLMNGACHIHIGTGALLMPGTQTTMNPLFNQNNNDNDDEGTNNGIIPMDISIEDAEKEDVIMNEIGNEENDGGEVVFDDCYDNNNDYGDDNDDGDDNGNGFVLHDKCGNHDNPIVSHIHHQTPECQDDQDKNTTPEIQDPWQMLLDPHDNSKFKKRPMKKGKTIRLPSECEDLPSDSVTGTRTKQIVQKKRKKKKNDLSYVCLKKEISEKVVKVESWDDCIATQSYKAAIARVKEEVERRQSQHIHNNDDDCSTIVMDDVNERRISIMDPIPLKGHLFSNEFHYIAKEQMTQKTIENRKRNKTCDGYKDNIVVDSVAAAITNERFRDMYEGDDDGDDQEGLINFGFGGDDHGGDDSDDDDINGGGDFICDHNNNNLERGSDFDEVFANDGSNDKDGSNNNHATFEELCRAHLKEFAKDAENYAVETQLTKRVGDWQSKLANVLAEEEERPEFNIKTYGNNVLSTMKRRTEHKKGKVDKKTNNIVNFASITKHQDPYEVSRTFLTSLMLCNTENITFCNVGEGEVSSPESLQLKLFNVQIDSPMDNYLAPSLLECTNN